MKYNIIYNSEYGSEVVDEAEDRKEAMFLREEYKIAFKTNNINIKRIWNF